MLRKESMRGHTGIECALSAVQKWQSPITLDTPVYLSAQFNNKLVGGGIWLKPNKLNGS